MLIMRRVAGSLVLVLLLTACGTKGPLYLPPPEQKAPQQNNKQLPPRP